MKPVEGRGDRVSTVDVRYDMYLGGVGIRNQKAKVKRNQSQSESQTKSKHDGYGPASQAEHF